MADFKIGDRVMCMHDNYECDRPVIWTLKKGNEYIVQKIKVCLCGEVILSVGAISHGQDVMHSCGCGFTIAKVNEVCEYFGAWRFVKVQEQPRIVRIQMDMPEPILN